MARDFAKVFYKSNAWKCARECALKRDHYLCVLCGAVAEEVHHITELTPDNINDLNISVNVNNLMSLCYPCHKNQHKKKAMEKVSGGNEYIIDSDGNIIPPGV